MGPHNYLSCVPNIVQLWFEVAEKYVMKIFSPLAHPPSAFYKPDLHKCNPAKNKK